MYPVGIDKDWYAGEEHDQFRNSHCSPLRPEGGVVKLFLIINLTNMKNTIDRRMLDVDITPITLAKIKSQGLTPYYYDENTDIVQLLEYPSYPSRGLRLRIRALRQYN